MSASNPSAITADVDLPTGVTAPLAHAFGVRYDLPFPLILFIFGGAGVVFASFLLVLRWSGDAEYPDGTAPEVGTAEVPVRAGGATVRAGGWVSLIALSLLVAGGFLGSAETAHNLLPLVFWVGVWVIVPVLCGALGDWTRPVNPYRLISGLADSPVARRALLAGPALRWPARLAHWPATAGFFAVACCELIFNTTATLPQATAAGLTGYALLCGLAGFFFGADAWLSRGELFSVLFSTWGRLGFFRFGAPGRRGWGGGFAGPFTPTASRVTFILLLLVAVAFDGVLATPAWKSIRLQFAGSGSSQALEVMTVAAFLMLISIAWLVFGSCVWAVRRAGRLDGGLLQAFAGLLPSLIPISWGYLIAHNVGYIATNVQLLVPRIGDPFGLGWHVLPYPFTDDLLINTSPVPSVLLWYGQLVLIVAVHVWAVVLAHRHIRRLAANASLARRAEWPWVIGMVGYTMTSLWLLAQPIVREG